MVSQKSTEVNVNQKPYLWWLPGTTTRRLETLLEICVKVCPVSPIMEWGEASGDVEICSCSTRSDEIKFCSAPESISAEIGKLIFPE